MKRIAANLTPLVTCPAFMLWHLAGSGHVHPGAPVRRDTR